MHHGQFPGELSQRDRFPVDRGNRAVALVFGKQGHIVDLARRRIAQGQLHFFDCAVDHRRWCRVGCCHIAEGVGRRCQRQGVNDDQGNDNQKLFQHE